MPHQSMAGPEIQRSKRNEMEPSRSISHPDGPPPKRLRPHGLQSSDTPMPDAIHPLEVEPTRALQPGLHNHQDRGRINRPLKGNIFHKGSTGTIPHESAALELHQNGSGKEVDKRVLRSQTGTSRCNSELALFFPDYEDYVFGPEKESGE